jgi:pimeloyl-ACP methyl ester carboxylesterase
VTVAAGKQGSVGPAAFAPVVVGQLGNGRLERFDDLGHFGPLEDPAPVAASILRAFGE